MSAASALNQKLPSHLVLIWFLGRLANKQGKFANLLLERPSTSPELSDITLLLSAYLKVHCISVSPLME